ncbi:MAG: T9SS type A sorting domain-containing protein [Candidatus Zixiibacteriota bacterium]|nr:MAG: T9SS type A sorting domain-containing protein [candidate division Zixibacteria bacterium]
MKKIAIFLLFLAFVVPAVNAAWWSGNASDNNISYDTTPDSLSSKQPRITMGPEGNLYCIWSHGPISGDGEMHFGKSTDNGVTWSSYNSDKMISADDGQNIVELYHAWAIATNSMGDIFIVWSESLTTNREIMLLKSTDYGDTWIHGNTDFNVSFAGSTVDAYDPEIAIDSNDNIYVVWSQYIAAVDSFEIHISISTDDGDTWTGRAADRAISYYDGFNAFGPSIAITPNNDIYVVWCELITPGWMSAWRIMYGKSTDGGATFNSENADNPISLEVIGSWPPQAVADNFGNVHVLFSACYEMFPLEELFYTGTTDGGVTWSGNSGMRNIDFGVGDNNFVRAPALAATSTGKLAAVWSENAVPYYYGVIYASYSHDGGLTWTGTVEPEILDFPDGRFAHNPDVIAGVGDTLYVVWNEPLTPTGPVYWDILISKGDTLAAGTADISSQVELPEQITLLQNYPNPFNASTTIKFNLSETRVVELTVYDLLGKEISRLLEEERQAGLHSITFDASDLSSGVYFYRLKTGREIKSRRMILLK